MSTLNFVRPHFPKLIFLQVLREVISNSQESHPHAWCRTAPEYPQVGEALEDPLAIAAKSSWVLDDVRVRGEHESPIFIG
jgi:hypothetical protein